jgi:hypothetical protein
MWNELLSGLKTIIASLEAQAGTAISFLLSFFKEAISEEEAALFPAFKEQVIQLWNDETKIAGLNVQQRVDLAVIEGTAYLAADLVLAKNALFNSWAWALAHQTGQTNGNQGSSTTGDFSGNANNSYAAPAA